MKSIAMPTPLIPKNIPILNATFESKSPCGYFYMKRENANEADAVINRIFGRSAKIYLLAMNGQIDLGSAGSGTSIFPSSTAKIERYIDENGRVGYRQEVEKK